MDLVKKNLVSVACGVIALVCVILIFFPLSGWYAAMTDEVKKSDAVGKDLTRIRGEKRTWPTLSSREEDRVPLNRFPTDAIINTGKTVTDSWTKQKDDFVAAVTAVQTNEMKELIPGVLPGPSPRYLVTRFQEAYGQLMNLSRLGTASAVANPTAVQEGPPRAVLNTPLVGRMPPTDAEVKARGDAEEATIRSTMPRFIDNVVVNQAEVEQEVVNRRNKLGDELRSEVARGSMVYLDPLLSFVASDKIVGSVAPAYDDIFMAQTGLWLQQELCRAVYDVNKPALASSKQGVVDAPIKRLIGIRFTLPYQLPPAPPAGTPAPTDVPVLPPIPAAKVAVDFTKNPLGHTSNDLYDVLPFRMSLVVEADTLTQTLAGLTHNRYITIRAVDVTAMDAALAYTQGFIYGSKPVVQVEIRGQFLLMRGFIGRFMPPNIIRGLAAPVAPAGVDPNAI